MGETTKARAFPVSPSVTECFYLKKTVTGYSIRMLPRTSFHAFVHGIQNMFSDFTLDFYNSKDTAESYIETSVLKEIFCRNKAGLGGGGRITFSLYNLFWDASHGICRELPENLKKDTGSPQESEDKNRPTPSIPRSKPYY